MPVLGFWIFFKVLFHNTKNAFIFTILVECGWLTNLSLLFWFDKVCRSSIQFDNSIEIQIDTLVKTVFSDSGGFKT